MGILLNAAYLMMVEGKRQPFMGKVLQLGRQSVLFPYSSLQRLADHAQFQLTDIGLITDDQNLTDIQFFTSLGFTEVKSLEYGTSENADYVWDMNDIVPPTWKESFDFIYDGGTIEHIFHIPNVMTNICGMLKVGGRVVHDGGISGMIDHGFYSIQPTFYHDFYTANEFKTDLFTVSKLSLQTWLSHTGEQTAYVPGMYDYHKTWANEQDAIYVGVCFATKMKPFERMVIPQQSIWARGSK
jgi:hypothetical protein